MATAIISQCGGFYGFSSVVVPFSIEECKQRLSPLFEKVIDQPGGGVYGIVRNEFSHNENGAHVVLFPHSGPEMKDPIEWDTGALTDDKKTILQCLRLLGN